MYHDELSECCLSDTPSLLSLDALLLEQEGMSLSEEDSTCVEDSFFCEEDDAGDLLPVEEWEGEERSGQELYRVMYVMLGVTLLFAVGRVVLCAWELYQLHEDGEW